MRARCGPRACAWALAALAWICACAPGAAQAASVAPTTPPPPVYASLGSFVSDDPTDRHAAPDAGPDPSKQLQWPGNKIVVPDEHVSYLTRPAAFGPGSTDADGLWGWLIDVDEFLGGVGPPDHRACPRAGAAGAAASRLVARRPRTPPRNWIALVERGDCSFVEKVRTAQGLGAVAVVVGDSTDGLDDDAPLLRGSLRDAMWDGDNAYEPSNHPIIMYPDGDADDIVIPSCFVVRSSYLELLAMSSEARAARTGRFFPFSKSPGLQVALFLNESLMDLPLFDLGILLLLLPSLITIVAMITHHLQMCIKRYRERASLRTVRALPCYVWRPNGAWTRVCDGGNGEDADAAKAHMARGVWRRAFARAYEQLQRVFARRPTAYEPLVPVPARPALDAEAADAPDSALCTDPEAADAVVFATPSEDAGAPTLLASLHPRWFVGDECPICLADFEDGDDWLTGTRRLCPTCKRDVTL
ncbi:RING-type E3 ubiquitin transferase [Malassezia sp. CBS 17886]|nr:RING-type E3 ubiquitin transferase [Malassezia sp. CBS 17886]